MSSDPRAIHRRALAGAVALVLAATLAPAFLGCGGANGNSNCDPHTIVVNGRCFWEKDRACDAIGCLPPSECVVLEGAPAKVECHKN
jgi:hypothetical protein